MTLGALLFWLFIGGPVALTIVWWVFMLVAAPFVGIGAGAQVMKDRKKNKRL